MNDGKLTYRDIIKRCKDSAQERLPDLPEYYPGCSEVDLWRAYLDEVESLDVYDIAHEEVDSWDWVIYTHYGVKILETLPMEIEQQAEDEFFDCYGGTTIGELSMGWREMASLIAFFALVIVMREELDTVIEETREFVHAQLESLESV